MTNLDSNLDKYVKIRTNRYETDTLENNWNEERFDINYIKKLKPALNSYDYFYETTYGDLTSHIPRPTENQDKANQVKKQGRIIAHPGHQLELNVNPWSPNYKTEYTACYKDFKIQKKPTMSSNNQKNVTQ